MGTKPNTISKGRSPSDHDEWYTSLKQKYLSSGFQLTNERELLQPRIQQCIKLIGSRKFVLDAGSSYGFVTSAISKNGNRVVGIDFPEISVWAKKHHPEIQFVGGNLDQALPFKDEKLDSVFSGEVVKHLLHPNKFLRECWRVLKPGGQIIITNKNLLSADNRLKKFLGGKVDTGVRDAHFFFIKDLRDLIKKNGFEVIHIIGVGRPYFPLVSRISPRMASLIWRLFPMNLQSHFIVIGRKLPHAGSALKISKEV